MYFFAIGYCDCQRCLIDHTHWVHRVTGGFLDVIGIGSHSFFGHRDDGPDPKEMSAEVAPSSMNWRVLDPHMRGASIGGVVMLVRDALRQHPRLRHNEGARSEVVEIRPVRRDWNQKRCEECRNTPAPMRCRGCPGNSMPRILIGRASPSCVSIGAA